MQEIIVFTTADTDELAERIAHALVEAREAACVNILPAVRSIYRWEGKVNRDTERLLLIKTSDEKFEAIRARIRKLHIYETPEIIAIPITVGDSDYLSWLSEALH